MPDKSSGRLIVVSNRLPVSVVRADGKWVTKRNAGGLATAMDPILRQAGGVWIGWSGQREPLWPDARELLLNEQGCVAVDLAGGLAERFYEGYANQALWPLFHSFPSHLYFDPDTWSAYAEANRIFRDAVVEQYQPGDRIWVHDYHLMLLPQLLREALGEAAIGFFLHIPFPSSDIFSLLPRGEELLSGLLGADLIAFHTHQHLQHFRRSLLRLLSVESTVDRVETAGAVVRLQALPIGIAPDDFLAHLDDADTREFLARLKQRNAGRKVIVAVDRLDYTKGLPERLRTYRRLLAKNPELKQKVVLLQVAVPSRENLASYKRLRREVHELISEINGKFGTADWVPVVYLHRSISRAELVAMYFHADVAWVSPLRDGMNLVAKEYVASKPNGDGVLVLSAFAGAAAEMGEALLVNPLDEERTAAAVLRALEMPERERYDRMRALHERVLRNNVFAWGERFLNTLSEAAADRRGRTEEGPPLLPLDEIVAAYSGASGRLLLLDYDGTLAPFTPRPHEATPDPELLSLLRRLAGLEQNHVVVISGRRTADLERWLGRVERLKLAAEHGAAWKLGEADGWQLRDQTTEWKDTVRPILEHFVDRTPGSFVEEKEFALVWHYRAAEPEFGEWLASELAAMLEGMLAETELRAYRGHKIVEVKPLSVNKGVLGAELVERFTGADFVLAIGDDRTDEDLFQRMPSNAWTVHVGKGVSRAMYRLPNTAAVRDLLRRLANQVQGVERATEMPRTSLGPRPETAQ